MTPNRLFSVTAALSLMAAPALILYKAYNVNN